jgi:hypothetical protein
MTSGRNLTPAAKQERGVHAASTFAKMKAQNPPQFSITGHCEAG